MKNKPLDFIISACGMLLALLFLAAPALAQSATRTKLTLLPSPSRAGQPVQLLADVDAAGGGAEIGSVTFRDVAVALGTAPLRAIGAGQATIAGGHFYTCALTNAGGAKCWGYNFHGQLGDGTTTGRITPVNVFGLTSGVAAIAAKYRNSCALTTGGGVRCWGWNERGQLGDGTTTTRVKPANVSGLASGVLAIAVGLDHTCALTSAGAVKCWGSNYNGQLGDGTTTDSLTPVVAWGLASGVASIAADGNHTCAVTIAGGAKCWGENNEGQLGDGTTTERWRPVNVFGLTSGVAAISSGGGGYSGHSCALTTAGGAKCWGYNFYGQIGDGTTTDRLRPVNVFRLTTGVTAVVAGVLHTCAVASVGRVRCWGNNNRGELGDGTQVDRLTPVTTLNLLTLVRARARFLTSTLAAGLHSLSAVYPGDATHLGSTGTSSHQVNP